MKAFNLDIPVQLIFMAVWSYFIFTAVMTFNKKERTSDLMQVEVVNKMLT